MSSKKIGYGITGIGIFGVLASFLVDYVGIGDRGIQSAQILGIVAGLLITVFGISLAFQVAEKRIDIGSKLKGGFEGLLNLPVGVWFMAGFLVVYIILFISPVYFDESRRLVYFNRFVPDRYPIGFDMSYTLDHVKAWVTTGQSPYPQSHYPPLTYILLSPLTLFDYPAYYFVTTFLTIISYIILTLVLPVLFTSRKDFSQIVLLSVTGLFSYGFMFELERGQYYTLAFLLCMLAIYLFHRHSEFQYLAFLLFSFSVHLKIVPIFFLPMFIKDWRDWKGNIKRMIGLGLLNVVLLFVLGYKNLLNFVDALLFRVETPTFLWNGNHSLGNFIFNFVRNGYGLFSENTILFLQENAKTFERLLLLIIFLCVVSIIFHIYRNQKTGFSSYLLLVCTICALVIPVSVDYTLPMLVAPLAIFLSSAQKLNGSKANKVTSIFLVFITSISYASLLFPFKYKPYFLNNSFPALFVVLIAITIFYFLQERYSNNTLNNNNL